MIKNKYKINTFGKVSADGKFNGNSSPKNEKKRKIGEKEENSSGKL